MKISVQKLNISAQNFLRRCGYLEIANPHKNNEISYARSLNLGRFYPRFHVYTETNQKQITLNLHLDAKKPSYEGTSAHSGEYDGLVIEKEARRILDISKKFLTDDSPKPIGFNAKKSWWQSLKNIFK